MRSYTQVSSDGGLLCFSTSVCMCVCVSSCTVSLSMSVHVSPMRREREIRIEGWSGKETERIGARQGWSLARVGDQACVYTESDGERRRGWGESEINVFVLWLPSYALGERKLAAIPRGGFRTKRMADNDDMAQPHVEYQPGVIAFVCKRCLFPPPFLLLFYHPLTPRHFLALVLFPGRICASISHSILIRIPRILSLESSIKRVFSLFQKQKCWHECLILLNAITICCHFIV